MARGSFHAELPRIYELQDSVLGLDPTNVYFWDFDRSVCTSPVKLKHFRDIEEDLKELDLDAWNILKQQVAQAFRKRDDLRGWQRALDRLNEATGTYF